MRTSLGLDPITQYEVDMLSIYDSEECRGVVHTDYWQGKMAALQNRFNLAGREMNKPTPPDLADTQPMEALNEGQRFFSGCIWGLFFSLILWAAIIILIVLVFA